MITAANPAGGPFKELLMVIGPLMFYVGQAISVFGSVPFGSALDIQLCRAVAFCGRHP